MSHSTSQDENIADFFRRKNLTVIPEDQDKLLQQTNAWAVDMKNTQYGLVNVPDHVIKAVKESYFASRQGQGQTGEQSTSKAAPEVEEPIAAPASPVASAPSSPERQVSWTPSPKRPSPRRPEMSAPSVVHETPTAPPPPSRHGDRLQVTTVYEPPSSNEVDELETHVPEGEGRATRRSRSPMHTQNADESSEDEESDSDDDEEMAATPPCAQPDEQVIPGTVTVEPAEAAAALNQRKRMKPIVFSDGSPVKPTTHNAAVPSRMQPVRQFDTMETQESSIPSSIIPATARDSLTQASMAEEAVSLAQALQAKQKESILAEEKEQERVNISEAGAVMKDAAVAVNSIGPFDQFQNVYSDYKTTYSGTLNKFIKACVCLEYLQRERALRECLYDEFIRSFSSGYLTYVAKAGANQEPLPAIEWFNIQRGPIIYGKMAITRDTLQHVLETHHVEVSKVRSLILGASAADETRMDDETPVRNQSTRVESEPMDVDEEPAAQTPVPPASQTPYSQSTFEPVTQVPHQSPPPVATPILRTPKPEPTVRSSAKSSAKSSARARQQISPRLGSGSPASSARAVPLASQYLDHLASRRKSSNPTAEAERRTKLLEFLRKRNLVV